MQQEQPPPGDNQGGPPSKRPKREPQGNEQTFANLAWPIVRVHYDAVYEWRPNAQANQNRSQQTRAILVSNDGRQWEGSSHDNLHAESAVYDNIWQWALGQAEGNVNQASDLFDKAVQEGRMRCVDIVKVDNEVQAKLDSHKPSCFMCAALAAAFEVEVEQKDRETYDNYALPAILRRSMDHLQRFVGPQAIAEYGHFATEGLRYGALNNLPANLLTQIEEYIKQLPADAASGSGSEDSAASSNASNANQPANADAHASESGDNNAPESTNASDTEAAAADDGLPQPSQAGDSVIPAGPGELPLSDHQDSPLGPSSADSLPVSGNEGGLSSTGSGGSLPETGHVGSLPEPGGRGV